MESIIYIATHISHCVPRVCIYGNLCVYTFDKAITKQLLLYNMHPTGKDFDFTVSSEEVHFSSGAPDGTESCITISAICDSSLEENETLIVYIGGSTQYTVETTGSEYSSYIEIIIMENTGIFACIYI